jgi:hypothetical protein
MRNEWRTRKTIAPATGGSFSRETRKALTPEQVKQPKWTVRWRTRSRARCDPRTPRIEPRKCTTPIFQRLAKKCVTRLCDVRTSVNFPKRDNDHARIHDNNSLH